jgi:hypothetical protein
MFIINEVQVAALCRETARAVNMSRNFPTALVALAHRAERQCLFDGRTLNAEKSLT